jgi:hypothetical protein
MTGVPEIRGTTDGQVSFVRHWLLHLSALGLGAVLVRSSMFHIANSYAFLSAIYSYKLVTPLIAVISAAVLPYLQLTLGIILLFFPRRRCSAFAWSASLFLVYSAAQVFAYARGLNIACGCFSPSADDPIGIGSIGTAIGCACVAVAGTVLTLRSRDTAQPEAADQGNRGRGEYRCEDG